MIALLYWRHMKVKKIKLSGPHFQCKEPAKIIGFELAVEEILFYNHQSNQEENRNKIENQLKDGFMINTAAHVYTIVNPNQDFINNIDDIDLDKEGKEFF